MATFTGKDGVARIGLLTIMEVRSFEVNMSVDLVNDTVAGDAWETNIAMQKKWDGSIDVLMDHTDTTGQNAAVVGATLDLRLFPVSTTATNPRLFGNAIITDRKVKHDYKDLIMLSLTFTGTSTLTEDVV